MIWNEANIHWILNLCLHLQKFSFLSAYILYDFEFLVYLCLNFNIMRLLWISYSRCPFPIWFHSTYREKVRKSVWDEIAFSCRDREWAIETFPLPPPAHCCPNPPPPLHIPRNRFPADHTAAVCVSVSDSLCRYFTQHTQEKHCGGVGSMYACVCVIFSHPPPSRWYWVNVRICIIKWERDIERPRRWDRQIIPSIVQYYLRRICSQWVLTRPHRTTCRPTRGVKHGPRHGGPDVQPSLEELSGRLKKSLQWRLFLYLHYSVECFFIYTTA